MAKTPLSNLNDYELVNEKQDIRGWKVEDYGGNVLGRVADLIVDTDRDVVTHIVTDNHVQYALRELELGDNRVLVGAMTLPQGVPAIDLVTGLETQPRIDANGDMRLQVVEERLRVGKRQVEQGGVRVSTQVSDRPVQTQVELREEHVDVVRRAVDRPATDADLANMKDRTVDVVEKAEVAVVSKEARVVEEVVVKREVDEHRETVHETVRHTDVEVTDLKKPANLDRLL